jgi:hypothetical protein
LLLFVLAGELAFAGWKSNGRSGSVEAASVGVSSTVADPQTTVTPTTVRNVVASTTTTIRLTPTTTTPRISDPLLGPGSVTYTVAAGTGVRVVANGRCWIQARRGGASGPQLDDVILKTGDVKSYTAPVWIRVGNTTQVTVTAGSTVLQLPPVTGNLTVNTA